MISLMWLCLWLCLWGCEGDKPQAISGEDLIESYFSALCVWYSEQECAIEISQCGDPVTAFSDWAQCMNAQNNRTNLCGQLPSIIEAQPQAISECIEIIESTTCETEQICPASGHILYEGTCGEVEETILQNCSPF